MMFIPILLLTLALGSQADLMAQDMIPPEPKKSDFQNPNYVGGERPQVTLSPEDSVKVTATNPNQVSGDLTTMTERSPPGNAGASCIDCAVKYLSEPVFSVRVPKLHINFEVKEFPSSKLLFTNLAHRVKNVPFIKSLSNPDDVKRIQLRSLGDVEVHISIPKFGWNQIMKLSDVISGFDIPKIPSIAPKVESCLDDCQSSL
ncbi:protein 2b [Soybean ilarvirus I]|uniref:Protein 2b n=1 Tax=Soybean ilarvirus I TaxID=2982525 RepID=A0A977XD48_9BROM|nr:protein 2b [Soybean ilarvirus I]